MTGRSRPAVPGPEEETGRYAQERLMRQIMAALERNRAALERAETAFAACEGGPRLTAAGQLADTAAALERLTMGIRAFGGVSEVAAEAFDRGVDYAEQRARRAPAAPASGRPRHAAESQRPDLRLLSAVVIPAAALAARRAAVHATHAGPAAMTGVAVGVAGLAVPGLVWLSAPGHSPEPARAVITAAAAAAPAPGDPAVLTPRQHEDAHAAAVCAPAKATPATVKVKADVTAPVAPPLPVRASASVRVSASPSAPAVVTAAASPSPAASASATVPVRAVRGAHRRRPRHAA
jgi:hypothetical protein